MLGVTRAVAVLACLYPLVGTVEGQPRVDSRNSYERILVVLPLIGAGTNDDPVRPMFIPAPAPASASPAAVSTDPSALSMDPTSRNGILGYTFILSDDGKFALTEIVMRDRAGFQPILVTAGIKTFIKGVQARTNIEAEFKKYKKDFDITKFGYTSDENRASAAGCLRVSDPRIRRLHLRLHKPSELLYLRLVDE